MSKTVDISNYGFCSGSNSNFLKIKGLREHTLKYSDRRYYQYNEDNFLIEF